MNHIKLIPTFQRKKSIPKQLKDLELKPLNEQFSKLTTPIISDDDFRPAMMGNFFDMESKKIVSTDAHKLTAINMPNETYNFIAQKYKKQLNENPKGLIFHTLKKMQNDYNDLVKVATKNSTDVFHSFDEYVKIRAIEDAKYPNYDAVIPKEFTNEIYVDFTKLYWYAKVLLDAKIINDTTLLVSSNENIYQNKKIEYLKDSYVPFLSTAKQIILTYTLDGKKEYIGFNAKFLCDILKFAIEYKYKTFGKVGLSGNSRAMVIEFENGLYSQSDSIGVIMPVMLDNSNTIGEKAYDFNVKMYYDLDTNEINSDGVNYPIDESIGFKANKESLSTPNIRVEEKVTTEVTTDNSYIDDINIDNKILIVEEKGKPLSTYKNGDKVFWANLSFDKNWKQYVEGEVFIKDDEYSIKRFPQNPNFKKYPLSTFNSNTKVVLKPNNEPIYFDKTIKNNGVKNTQNDSITFITNRIKGLKIALKVARAENKPKIQKRILGLEIAKKMQPKKMNNGGGVVSKENSIKEFFKKFGFNVEDIQKDEYSNGIEGWIVFYDNKNKYRVIDYSVAMYLIVHDKTTNKTDIIKQSKSFNIDNFDNGGGVTDLGYNYKSVEEIWDNWTTKQKEHFLYDHQHEYPEIRNISKLANLEWNDLKINYVHVLNSLSNHIREGRYNKGGVVFTNYNGSEIMYEPNYDEYFVNDEVFYSMEDAKNYIDTGEIENEKYGFGGGLLVGSLVGGYLGYKVGKYNKQTFSSGFDTEKRIGKDIKNKLQGKKTYAGGGGVENEIIMTDIYATKNGEKVKVNSQPMELNYAENWIKEQGIDKYYTDIDFKFISKQFDNGGAVDNPRYAVFWLNEYNSLQSEYFNEDELDIATDFYEQIKNTLYYYAKVKANVTDLKTQEIIMGTDFKYDKGGEVDTISEEDLLRIKLAVSEAENRIKANDTESNSGGGIEGITKFVKENPQVLALLKKGGSVGDENYEMLKNKVTELLHHSKELQAVVKKKPKTPAWVISKSSRASTDLSDITHYLEGKL